MKVDTPTQALGVDSMIESHLNLPKTIAEVIGVDSNSYFMTEQF